MPNLSDLTISEICSSHFHTEPHFKGVYASDNLPAPTDLQKACPCFIITNTDPTGEPGQHWNSIFVDDYNAVTYFCSLGTEPKKPIYELLTSIGKVSICAGEWQTANGDLCGEYSLFFSDLKCRNFNNSDIENLLDTENLHFNDCLINQYVYGHMTL